MRAGFQLRDMLDEERGTFLLWLPVGLAVGIAVYFSVKFEPNTRDLLGVLAASVFCSATAAILPYSLRVLLLGLALVGFGFLIASLRAQFLAAPVLNYHYYGAVHGRIVAVDRSASDKPRITLDRVRLARMGPARFPARVRVSLHYPLQSGPYSPGQHVMLTANLSPPAGPVEPGGFDFQRFAWFRKLGAVGYSRNPIVEFAPPDVSGFSVKLMRFRLTLSKAIRDRIPGQKGAFAAAILTGDRAAIAPENLVWLRASNLAHLLAISGLHMGLLTGIVFAFVRSGLALFPFVALRLPVKKIAAVAAFFVAVSYLFLSGTNVATQRAFVMVAVMLVAVLLDRRALTLRAVAIAAVIVLVFRPESLIEAGFQMSFAATTALVAVFSALRDRQIYIPSRGIFGPFIRHFVALFLSSLVAGLATAPISAFHFNQIAQYGLLANLASVPMMGFVVMPSAVLAILLTPFGLANVFWFLMGAGIEWILVVAGHVSGLTGAVTHVPKPGTIVLGLIGSGAVSLILLRGRLRYAAVPIILSGFVLWCVSSRPTVLISENGRLIGVLNASKRALNREKGNGFSARSWLENDGDPAVQEQAAARGLRNTDPLNVKLANIDILYVWSKNLDQRVVEEMCDTNALVIAPRFDGNVPDCVLVGKKALKTHGSVAVRFTKAGVLIEGAKQKQGQRYWSK